MEMTNSRNQDWLILNIVRALAVNVVLAFPYYVGLRDFSALMKVLLFANAIIIPLVVYQMRYYPRKVTFREDGLKILSFNKQEFTVRFSSIKGIMIKRQVLNILKRPIVEIRYRNNGVIKIWNANKEEIQFLSRKYGGKKGRRIVEGVAIIDGI